MRGVAECRGRGARWKTEEASGVGAPSCAERRGKAGPK